MTKHTDTSRSGDLVKECRLDAKAFRENTVYDSDGDPIRLIANAERLDQYADCIETQAREIERLRVANQAAAECVAAMMEECARYRNEIRAALAGDSHD